MAKELIIYGKGAEEDAVLEERKFTLHESTKIRYELANLSNRLILTTSHKYGEDLSLRAIYDVINTSGLKLEKVDFLINSIKIFSNNISSSVLYELDVNKVDVLEEVLRFAIE